MTQRKILIALDLDDTHFIACRKGAVHWLGDKVERVNTYLQMIQSAEQCRVEVIFAVVTSKMKFDDICEEAGKSFKELLVRGNPGMLTVFDGEEYLLVNKFGNHIYECLTSNKSRLADPDATLNSHFHIVHDDKVEALLSIGKAHDIAAENIMLLDDTEYKLYDARQAGMQTVSFACFNNVSPTFFDNHDNVNSNLTRITKELLHTFNGMLQKFNNHHIVVEFEPIPPLRRNCFYHLFSCCTRGKSTEAERKHLLAKSQ